MELTGSELLTLGLGGAFLMGTCVIEAPFTITLRTLCFALGVGMLVVALLCMAFGTVG